MIGEIYCLIIFYISSVYILIKKYRMGWKIEFIFLLYLSKDLKDMYKYIFKIFE